MKNGILKIFVCCHKYIHRVEEIKARVDKWNLGDYLIFVGGEEEKQLKENVIQLKCRDLYEDLPEKMFAIYTYLSNLGYSDFYDYFWKIDDDIDFIKWNINREENLYNELKGHHYCGFKLKPGNKGGKRGWHIGRVQEDSPWHNKRYDGEYIDWIDGGTTYFLSSFALNKWKDFAHLNQVRYNDIYEDLAVAKYLSKFDIFPSEIDPWEGKMILKFNINK